MKKPEVLVRCVGGPADGNTGKTRDPRKVLRLIEDEGDGTQTVHVYDRKGTRTGIEYRFRETISERCMPSGPDNQDQQELAGSPS